MMPAIRLPSAQMASSTPVRPCVPVVLGERDRDDLVGAEQRAEAGRDDDHRSMIQSQPIGSLLAVGPAARAGGCGRAHAGQPQPAESGDRHHGQQAGQLVDLDSEHGDQDRAGHEDGLVDDRLERERRMQQRPALQHVRPARSDGGADRREASARRGRRTRAGSGPASRPAPSTRARRCRSRRRRSRPAAPGADRSGRSAGRGSGEEIAEASMYAADTTPACAVRAGLVLDQQHDAERDRRDRQPGQQPGAREREGPGFGQHFAVRTKHPRQSSDVAPGDASPGAPSAALTLGWQDRSHARPLIQPSRTTPSSWSRSADPRRPTTSCRSSRTSRPGAASRASGWRLSGSTTSTSAAGARSTTSAAP